MRPVWDLSSRKRFFLLHHLCRREPVRITAMLAAGSSLWVAALTVMEWMFAMFCMARHYVAVLFSVAKIENRPVGIWPDG